MPAKEINFQRNNSTGRVLNYIVQRSIEEVEMEEHDIINTQKIEQIVASVNDNLSKFSDISGDFINAYLNEDGNKLLSRMLEIGDNNNRELSSLGEGVQYFFSILLQIIETIYEIKKTRKEEEFEDRLLVCNDKKLLPIFVFLDEPEIHQHPYRQRSLIKKVNDILNNKNETFIDLMRYLFKIDGLTGQLFIATHSPNILLNDYKQFIRIYKDDTSISTPMIISGMNINLNNSLYKHLLRSLIYLKEAMFSKYILFVEGDTENGAIPIFARRENLDLDEKCISVVKLDGADSVKRCMELYKSFGINCIAIIDADKKQSYDGLEGIYFIDKNDFEEDVYDDFSLDDYLQYVKRTSNLGHFIGILKQYDSNLDIKAFQENLDVSMLSDEVRTSIMTSQRTKELENLKESKNAMKGCWLAELVTNIPQSFKTVIDILKEI